MVIIMTSRSSGLWQRRWRAIYDSSSGELDRCLFIYLDLHRREHLACFFARQP
jgi:hypothetical protein